MVESRGDPRTENGMPDGSRNYRHERDPVRSQLDRRRLGLGAAGHPVFARYGVRDGINVYLTTNRPDEATMLAEGKMITRPNEGKLEPLDCSILPRDYEITRKSKIQITQIERTAAQYYRKLWTHNFVGSSAPINMAVLIDGKLAGVFGLDKSALTMGAFGTQVSDAVFLMYGMTVPHKTYRLGRLLTMLAQNRPLIMNICTDLEKEKAKSLKTVQMTFLIHMIKIILS